MFPTKIFVMPYCSQCGSLVGAADAYCHHCGARQPVPKKAASGVFSSLSARNASVLCYIPILGWIAAIVVLASARFRHDRTVRFHAFQGLYLFVAWLIVDWAVTPMFGMIPGPWPDHDLGMTVSLAALLKLLVFGTWIYMIVKTSRDETCRLPLLGELAERSLAEQH